MGTFILGVITGCVLLAATVMLFLYCAAQSIDREEKIFSEEYERNRKEPVGE